MNTIFYDLRRTFRSRFVIVMMLIIILSAALISYALTNPGQNIPKSQRVLNVSTLFLIVNGIFSVLIPIMAIFEGYVAYGADRASGVLESVICRPVTKTGVLISRFVAGMIAIIIALAIAIAIIDATALSYYSKSLPLQDIAALFWIYIVEGAAFLGLMYLFSHILKSQTSLIGVAIAVFLVLDILWTTIVTLVAFGVFNAGSSPSKFISIETVMDFISPTGYEANMLLYLTKETTAFVRSSGLGAATLSVNPASYGVTLISLALIGIAWMVVPVLLAYMLAMKRD
jgi:ABC-type transport system involved in multi-copper enzyme maturation permease subunit